MVAHGYLTDVELLRDLVNRRAAGRGECARRDCLDRCVGALRDRSATQISTGRGWDREISIFVGGRGGQGVQTLARVIQHALTDESVFSTMSPWYSPEVRRGITLAKLRLGRDPMPNPDI